MDDNTDDNQHVNDDARLQLVPAAARSRLLMFALCVPMPWLIIAISMTLPWFIADGAIATGSASPALRGMASAFGPGLIAVLTLPVLAWIVLDFAMRRHHLQVTNDRLVVKSSFHSLSVSIAELELDKARVIDLHERGDFTPAGKRSDYAIAGFKSGHFRLMNGNKAFVAIAGQRRVLWLPTTTGPGLLLQSRQPDALL
jgi:hypothetical protein